MKTLLVAASGDEVTVEKSGADIIIETLERLGIQVLAGMPGGANLPLYDALSRSRIRHVLVRHEQAAGFIAQGMARASGRPAVCLATSGPGATNLVTALADAHLDSVPIIAITGQVPTTLLGTSAFQEVDTVSIVRPIVKHAVLVRDVNTLADTLASAFEIASSGRPGPVLIDVPKDVLESRCTASAAALARGAAVQPRLGAVHASSAAPARHAARDPQLAASTIARFAALLTESERPVLYVGGGVVHAGAHAALARFVDRQDLPVACSLMGLGCFDPHDARYLGMLGMHGAPFTNLVMREADLLICIGARFDDRATGNASEFCPGARTVHVDIDPRELGKLRVLELAIAADARAFLEVIEPHVPVCRRAAWQARVAALRARHPLPACIETQAATRVLRALETATRADAIVCTDVGQHQMWVAQLWRFERPRTLLTSGGLGSMGFGLPAAIGAALASRRPVLCITGDGSLPINLQELATLAELALDITIVVLDNGHLGLVRQQQVLFYGSRLCASAFERPLDFVRIARAFDLAACHVGTDPASLAQLGPLLAGPGPRLIQIAIAPEEMVLPMVPPGAGNHVMIETTNR